MLEIKVKLKFKIKGNRSYCKKQESKQVTGVYCRCVFHPSCVDILYPLTVNRSYSNLPLGWRIALLQLFWHPGHRAVNR